MSSIPPADALLTIDIGNTRVGLAICDEDGLHDTRRVATAEPGSWRNALREAWEGTRNAQRRAVVIGSVSPADSERMRALAHEVSGLSPLRIRDDIPFPIPLDIERPEEVGVDRICSAAAAYERIQEACAVASFGTAITIDCVSPDGRFLGGVILPGLELSCAALHDGTAQLPRVHPTSPAGPLGRTTVQAINAGVVFGAVGALREVVERMATELGEWPHLVLTGGNAALIREHADFIDSVVPDLCLMGISLAYRRAAGQA
jgi:type III pantothenate kinase